MRACLLITIFAFFMANSVNARQTIPQVAHNEYKFAKGKILVSLADTVSPDFISYQFHRMGYEIITIDIYPVWGYFNKNISESELSYLSSHPYISQINVKERGFNEQAFLEMVKRQNMSSEDSIKSRRVFENFANSSIKRVTFNYFVTEEMASTFVETLPELEIKLNMTSPRSVVIKTEVGQEREIMKTLNLIKYVENTAFITLERE